MPSNRQSATLQLVDVTMPEADSTAGAASAAYFGARLALLGAWDWLLDYLRGARPLSNGVVEALGQDARDGVITGSVGIASEFSALPQDDDVEMLLELNLLLLGLPRAAAKRNVNQELSHLGLQFLRGRKLKSLNPAEQFATQAALAASTNPRLLVLEAPSLRTETRAFELALIERLAQAHYLAIRCRADEQHELLCYCDEVAYAGPDGPAPGVEAQVWLAEGRRYRLLAFRGGVQFARALEERGVQVHTPPSSSEVMVTLPEGASTKLIFEVALHVGASVRELAPLPARSA